MDMADMADITADITADTTLATTLVFWRYQKQYTTPKAPSPTTMSTRSYTHMELTITPSTLMLPDTPDTCFLMVDTMGVMAMDTDMADTMVTDTDMDTDTDTDTPSTFTTYTNHATQYRFYTIIITAAVMDTVWVIMVVTLKLTASMSKKNKWKPPKQTNKIRTKNVTYPKDKQP